jgi:hypothetical protein
MDRESQTRKYVWSTGNSGESEPISTARAAWQSIHFPNTGFVDSTLTYEQYNEADGTWVAAVDEAGNAIATVSVTGGMVLPVNVSVNHGKVYRIKMSSAQPANLEFAVVHKL